MPPTIIISTAERNVWQCPPNAVHAGIVEWYQPDRAPLCPVCGRSKSNG